MPDEQLRESSWTEVEGRILAEAFDGAQRERVRRSDDLQAAGLLSAGVVASAVSILVAVTGDAAAAAIALPSDFVTLTAMSALLARVERRPRSQRSRRPVDPDVVGREAADRWLQQRYLRVLGVAAAPPSLAALQELHRAHVQRFAHDTVWKSRGRIPEMTERGLVQALVDGEGGGCVHLNGSFVWLLRRLGYDARLHRGRVQRAFDAELGPRADAHAVLTVDVEGQRFYADVGMGNGLLEAVPLRDGEVHQAGGFGYRLETTGLGAGVGGRFHHDRRLLAMRTVQFEERPAALEEFGEGFHRDATDPDSVSLRHLMVNRRREDGVSVMAGRTLLRHGEGGRSMRRIESADEWEHLLREELLLALPQLTGTERDELWAKTGAR